jgi:hypothetical protein
MKPEEVADEVREIRKAGLLMLVSAQKAVRAMKKGAISTEETNSLLTSMHSLIGRIDVLTANFPSPNHIMGEPMNRSKAASLEQLISIWRALYSLQNDLNDLAEKLIFQRPGREAC